MIADWFCELKNSENVAVAAIVGRHHSLSIQLILC